MNIKKNLKWLLLLFVATVNFSLLNSNLEAKSITKLVEVYKNNVLQETKYGMVQGRLAESEKVLVWEGIPYAKADRWKSPVAIEKWDGVLDATKVGKVGVQLSGKNVIGSEDCLNLDVFRPNNSNTNLPIIVYIHGGNNQSGTSKEISPEKLSINTNSIVVSVNYRLGLFGFNNLPSLKTGNKLEDSGNYTLLDIAKSLDWVEENASYFGGNNKNVTVSGFSAGGRDVMAMLISPLFKNKFQKAISFSGGMTIANSVESQKLFAKALAPLVIEDKVKNTEEEAYQWLLTDKKEVRDYLYSLSADRLGKLMTNAGIRMNVFPHLFNDGIVLPKDGFDAKNYNNVPLLMVTGSSEFSLFGRFDSYFAKYDDKTLLTDDIKSKEYAFVYKYGNRLYGLFNAQESAERMFSNYKNDIYTCNFDWGTNPEINGERTAKLYGALHGIWIPFLTDNIMGASGLIKDSFNNNGTKDLTKVFTSYVKNFIWQGNPNGEGLVKWNKWQNIEKGNQLLLNADNEKSIIIMATEKDSYNKIIKDIKADRTVDETTKKVLLGTVLNGRWFSKGLDSEFGNTREWIQVK